MQPGVHQPCFMSGALLHAVPARAVCSGRQCTDKASNRSTSAARQVGHALCPTARGCLVSSTAQNDGALAWPAATPSLQVLATLNFRKHFDAIAGWTHAFSAL